MTVFTLESVDAESALALTYERLLAVGLHLFMEGYSGRHPSNPWGAVWECWMRSMGVTARQPRSL